MSTDTRDTHKVEIVITPDGKIEGEVKGMLGPGCEGILDDLIAPLGKIVSHTRTREHRLRPGQTTRHRNRLKQ